MKKSIVFIQYKLSFLLLALLTTVYAFAQDEPSGGGSATTVSKTTTSSTTATGTDWYAAPWVWVVGIAVFILLLFAIIRGNSSKTTDVHRTTVRKDVTTE